MPKPRSTQISLEATPYYHCTSRCVRRAFLCGMDIITGENYEHRRQWLEDKLFELNELFALDICSYAIMSNHYHLVLHINHQQAQNWSFDDVIRIWHKLHAGTFISQQYASGQPLFESQRDKLGESVELWRERLMDISGFMREINESIARQVNAEDKCTGRFWEGRFKSQALLDEPALLTCMAYVDLNPIRAAIADTPEESDYTSIKQRIHETLNPTVKDKLFSFTGNINNNMLDGIPFSLNDYIELVEETGRTIRDDKRGYIHQNTPPILKRLNINSKNWLYLTQHFESKLKGLVGSVQKLKQACKKLGYKRPPGLQVCRDYFT